MWKNIVEPGGPQTAICGLPFACWITKATNTHSSSSYMALQLLYRVLAFSANSFHLLLSWAGVFQFGTFIFCISFLTSSPQRVTNTHSEYVIFITFPLQQWLRECASVLRYTYFICPFYASQRDISPKITAFPLKDS